MCMGIAIECHEENVGVGRPEIIITLEYLCP